MSIQIYTANWVLPVDKPPIPNGEVVVEDGIIQEVRPQKSPESDREELGDAILMPGLINAHSHIEYTALRGQIEDIPFFPWIRALMASKTRLDRLDWLWSGRLAALELIAGGITTIGDNADAGISAQVAQECGLRATVYQELFGIDNSETVYEIITRLDDKLLTNSRFESDRVRLGISPHAPYTIRPELFKVIAEYLSDTNLGTSIHVAETDAETDLIQSGSGPFAEMFQKRGIEWSIPGVSPTRYIYDMQALTTSTLAVHCVHQSREDIELIASTGASIVHCPKSNGKLGAGIAPLAEWLKTDGLCVALGTDSAVSNNGLDLFEEMRFALLSQRAATRSVECVTAKQIVHMATLGGAQAMGISDHTGSLTPGKKADLIAVRLDSPHSTPATDPYAAIAYTSRAADVCLTICDGVLLYSDGDWTTLNKDSILAESRKVREKAAKEV